MHPFLGAAGESLRMRPVRNGPNPTPSPVGPLLGRSWAAIGPLLGRYWAAIGPLLGRCWAAVGPLLGRCWAAVGPLLGRCWASIGPLLGLYWASIGPLLGLYWASIGPLLGRCKHYSRGRQDATDSHCPSFTASQVREAQEREAPRERPSRFPLHPISQSAATSM